MTGNDAGGAEEPIRLRIGTWNVREGVPVDPDADVRGQVVELVRDHRIDVLALQEVPYRDDSSSDLLDTLTRRTRLVFTGVQPLSPRALPGAGRSGVALASRFPLHDVTGTVLPNPGLAADGLVCFDKGLVSAAARVGGHRVTLTSAHLFPFHIFRRRAEEDEFRHVWERFAKEIGSRPERPIVAGDFNTPHRELVTGLLDTELASAFHLDGRGEDILVGAGFRTLSCEIVPNFSDHPLWVVELALLRGGPPDGGMECRGRGTGYATRTEVRDKRSHRWPPSR
ncbi:endonuclease/exonuclease/phosphatase family protein [Streptosporangium fragile]|uniref:endonuclease/exonuclease/phosphatase family protein n=1 Tax=Streptosporangium fragile TaxID=46186 RepID=UPI0031E64739